MSADNDIADALVATLTSETVPGAGPEAPANVVDLLHGVAAALSRLAGAVTPTDAAPARDSHGGYVGSVTEALMGVERSLAAIAAAGESIAASIDGLADAVRAAGRGKGAER